MKRLAWLLTGILLLSGCGGDQLLSPLAPDADILAFGDSLTAGNGAPADGSYPA
jgi:acyl-CoA thioesterase-1